MKVYLSGGMQFAKRSGSVWREDFGLWVDRELGHLVIDPVQESRHLLKRLRGEHKRLFGASKTGGDWPEFFREIVRRDIDFVRSSDYVVCLWNDGARRGAGTQGELTIARDAAIPVYLVARNSLSKLPGWIQGCTTAHFNGFVSLKRFLIQQYRHE